MMAALRAHLPGLFILGLVAATAQLIGSSLPLLTPLVLAIGISAIVANTVGLPTWAGQGVSNHSLLLETAIVLLGASLSVDAILAAGPRLVLSVVIVVVFGLVLATVLSRLANLSADAGSLLAAGSSICGVSAIAAVAPVSDATDAQIAQAAATILLFDAVTLIAFPIVGQTFNLDSQFYGIWIGLAMFSTGPVAAAGFAQSPVAGTWATLTKLTRNSLIGAVVMWYSLRSRREPDGTVDLSLGRAWNEFPKFLIGFILVAFLTNFGAFPPSMIDSIEAASDVLFLLAFSGLGFDISVGAMRNTGLAAVGIVGSHLVIVSGVAYLLVVVLF